jgi:hypothetical protein
MTTELVMCMGCFWDSFLSIHCGTKVRKIVLSVAVFSFASCSGPPHGQGISFGPNGDATLAVTLRATPLAPPPNTNLLSFSATVLGISLTPSTGGSLGLPLNSTLYQIDLTRLQSDTALVSLSTAIPPGTYDNMIVSLANPMITYCRQTQGTSGCAAGSVTTVSGGPATPIISTVPFPLMLVHGQTAGLAVVMNLTNALTMNPQSQAISSVNLGAADVVGAMMLPPASSTLPASSIEFIDDITGVVSSVDPISESVTVQTATRGPITAKASSSTIVSPNCTTFNLGDTFACAKPGQVASLDVTLNTDGTFSLVEYDPLGTTEGDWIEGIVVQAPSSSTEFEIVANDLVVASSNSLIGGKLELGAPVTVNLVNPKPFVVDGKGLSIPVSAFDGATDASILQPGETLALHVTAFTPASESSIAAASVDFVYLRFTRVTGLVAVAAPPNTFTMQSFPSFFGLSLPVTVQLSSGSPSTKFDGISDASSLVSEQTVSITALYFGSPTGPTPTPTPLCAAKVRVH